MPKYTLGLSEKILLFKPKNKSYKAYIRKGHNYAIFKAIASVSQKNEVECVGAQIYANFKSLKNFDDVEKKIFSEKNYSKGNPDDYYYIYYIHQPLYLNKPLQLTKPVRGIRYATADETYDIKKEIIKALAKLYNISYEDVFWNWGEYARLYSESIQLDFQDVLFDLEKSGELYEHWKKSKNKNTVYPLIGDNGQTKLM